MSALKPETVHATAIAIEGHGVLLTGSSDAGKSDLALRLIDRGATLVSDDQTELRVENDTILLNPPDNIAGKIEIRALGIISVDHVKNIPLRMKVRLVDKPDRYPMDRQSEVIEGIRIACVSINAFEHSAPVKVEIALKRLMAQENMS